jgi:hypothetical protein
MRSDAEIVESEFPVREASSLTTSELKRCWW